MNFIVKENWAGYSNLDVEGKKIAFGYNWEEIIPDYLNRIVVKYPNIFELESIADNQVLLKIKPDALSLLNIEILLDIVDNDESEWFELVDMETKKLLNTKKNNQESIFLQNLD